MARFLGRRLLFTLITLFVVSIAIFLVTQVLPGDVAKKILGQWSTPEDYARLREKLGLNRPLWVQYLDWLTDFIRGDWGHSLVMQVEVRPLIFRRLRNSLLVFSIAFILTVPLSIGLGIVAGVWEGKWPDAVISVVSLIGISLPEFVTAIFLIIIFGGWLKILPPASLIIPDANPLENIKILILPALTVCVGLLGYISRMQRTSVANEMASLYTRTAVLKGLPRRVVVLKHVLRNALLPTITIVAVQTGWMIGGLIIVESVFGWPGLGNLLLFAMTNQDLPLLQGVVMLIATVYCLANVIADLLYALLNPRIRYA